VHRAADLLEATAPPGTRKLVAGSALSQQIDDGNIGGGRKVTAASLASHGRRRSRGPPPAGDGSLDAARHREALGDDGLLRLWP
jgi:hypothetical protein